MTDDHHPLDDLLRAQLVAHEPAPAVAAATRDLALLELHHARRRSGWRYRLEAGAMLAAAAGQLIWVFGTLFGNR
jgi:hypothetical protein